MSFDEIFDLTAGVYFYVYNILLANMSSDEIFDLTAGAYFFFIIYFLQI